MRIANMKTVNASKPSRAEYKTTTTCRACQGDIQPILNMGQPCVSDFILANQPEYPVPLELVLCVKCGLVQLHHTVDREFLYRDYYYQSGTNESMVAALKDIVRHALEHVTVYPGDVVLDIGSNDGTLLNQYEPDLFRVGFEPSNLAEEQSSSGIVTYQEFFPPSNDNSHHWSTYMPSKPKIITSIAMFYDLDNPHEFLEGIRKWLHPEGVWVAQFQGLEEMLSVNAFDNICHEHLLYLSKPVFIEMARLHGLELVDHSMNSVNGGSSRFIFKHGRSREHEVNIPWAQVQMEAFASRVELLRDSIHSLLSEYKQAEKPVLGYGASTKGNTLLQYCGIDSSLLPAIADRNSAKWGRVTAGSHIPIMSEKEVHQQCPEYLFVLPWHFLSAFKDREAIFLKQGGKFLLPLPKPRVVSI